MSADRGSWASLSRPWQVCVTESWASFVAGSIPIGAAVVDGQGEIVAVGRNRTRETDIPHGQIANTQIAHAEINALAQVVRTGPGWVIYSAVEPCPMCAGAIYMGGIRQVYFAARDPYAGGTDLYGMTPYLQVKAMQVFGPYPDLEAALLVWQAAFFLMEEHPRLDRLLPAWERIMPESVALARRLVSQGFFARAIQSGLSAADVLEITRQELFS